MSLFPQTLDFGYATLRKVSSKSVNRSLGPLDISRLYKKVLRWMCLDKEQSGRADKAKQPRTKHARVKKEFHSNKRTYYSAK